MTLISAKPIRWSWRYRRTRRGCAYRHGFAFTFAGISYIFITLMVGLAAANQQINLLFLVFGVLLGGLLVSGVVSTLTLTGLRVYRRLPPSAMAGQSVAIRYEVANRKRWLSSYSLHIREHRGPAPCSEAYLPAATASSSISQPGVLRCDRRGIYRFQAVSAYTRFPFSLFVHFARFREPAELVVYPTLGRLMHDAAALIGRSSGTASQPQAHSGGQEEFYGLREYRLGDNPRWIHWRRSARVGTLLVREMSPLAPRRLVLVLSICQTPGGEPIDPPRLEKALSLATTLVNDTIRRGLPVGLLIAAGDVIDERRWFPPTRGRRLWESMMRAIASLNPTGHPAAPLPREALRQLARSQCLWITAGLSETDVRRQLAALADWNISAHPIRVEQADLDRLIALPPPT